MAHGALPALCGPYNSLLSYANGRGVYALAAGDYIPYNSLLSYAGIATSARSRRASSSYNSLLSYAAATARAGLGQESLAYNSLLSYAVFYH